MLLVLHVDADRPLQLVGELRRRWANVRERQLTVDQIAGNMVEPFQLRVFVFSQRYFRNGVGLANLDASDRDAEDDFRVDAIGLSGLVSKISPVPILQRPLLFRQFSVDDIDTSRERLQVRWGVADEL